MRPLLRQRLEHIQGLNIGDPFPDGSGQSFPVQTGDGKLISNGCTGYPTNPTSIPLNNIPYAARGKSDLQSPGNHEL